MLRRATQYLVTNCIRPRSASTLYRPSRLDPSVRIEFNRLCCNMSTAPHPVHSTATPADPAAPISTDSAPVTPAAEGAPPAQPKKEKKDKKGKKGDVVAGMAALELDPKPEYFDSRIQMFDRLKKEYDEKIASEYLMLLSCSLDGLKLTVIRSRHAPRIHHYHPARRNDERGN